MAKMMLDEAKAVDGTDFRVRVVKGVYKVVGGKTRRVYSSHTSEADAVGEMNSMSEIAELSAAGIY